MGTPVVVEFSVLDKLSAHVKQMNDTMTGFSKSVTSSFGSITKGLVSVGAAFGVFQGVKFLGDMVQKSINYGDAITDMARRTGLTTDKVQELSFIAKQTGTSIESLQRSFIMISKKAYDSDKTFETLGISLKDNNGILKDSGTIFNETILKLSGVQNTTERMALSQKIFGKASIEVNGIIAQGSERIQELLGQTRKYGLVLDSQMIEKLHDAKEQQELWNQQIVIMTARISTLALPLIDKWMTGVSDLLAAEERWQKLKSATVDPRAIALAKEIETLSLAKTKAEENGFAIVKVNSAYVTWSGTIEEAKNVLSDLQAEQAKLLNTAPKKRAADLITDPDAGKKEDAVAAASKNRMMVTAKAEKVYRDDQRKTYDQWVKYYQDSEKNTTLLLEKSKEKQRDDDKKIAERIAKDGIKGKEDVKKLDKEISQSKIDSIEREKAYRRSDIADNISGVGSVFSAFANANKRNAQERKNIARVESIINTAVGITRAIPDIPMMVFAGLAGIAQQVAISNANFAGGIRNNRMGTWATVGEQGPEKRFIPAGASIYNNSETRNMDNSQSTVFHAHFYNSSGDEIESIRSKLRSHAGDQLVRDIQAKMARSI
jgi:hypothetical protein